MAKKFSDFGAFAYSTNPDFKPEETNKTQITTPAPQQQDLRILRDSKQRAGKTVTLVTGFVGNDDDLIALGRMLKAKCGTGGTIKDGAIIIQGDVREKVFQLLLNLKYKVKKAGG